MSCDGYTPKERPIPKWQKISILIAIVVIVLVAIFIEGCGPAQRVPPKTVVLKIESEIPVKVSIHKSCEGNWNFCRYQ